MEGDRCLAEAALLVVAAVGGASPVQGEAVLARRTGWAVPGRWQWGRPVGAAPVSGAGPGPRPHHGDGPVQLVRDALWALHRRAGEPGCSRLLPSALAPQDLGQAARPLRASPPPTSSGAQWSLPSRGPARDRTGCACLVEGSGLRVPSPSPYLGPEALVGWRPGRFWPLETSCTPTFLWEESSGRRLGPQDRGSSVLQRPAPRPPSSPRPLLPVARTWVVVLRVLTASQQLLGDSLPGTRGGEQQGRGGVQGALPALGLGPVSGGERVRGQCPGDDQEGRGALLGAKPPLRGTRVTQRGSFLDTA